MTLISPRIVYRINKLIFSQYNYRILKSLCYDCFKLLHIYIYYTLRDFKLFILKVYAMDGALPKLLVIKFFAIITG